MSINNLLLIGVVLLFGEIFFLGRHRRREDILRGSYHLHIQETCKYEFRSQQIQYNVQSEVLLPQHRPNFF